MYVLQDSGLVCVLQLNIYFIETRCIELRTLAKSFVSTVARMCGNCV